MHICIVIWNQEESRWSVNESNICCIKAIEHYMVQYMVFNISVMCSIATVSSSVCINWSAHKLMICIVYVHNFFFNCNTVVGYIQN